MNPRYYTISKLLLAVFATVFCLGMTSPARADQLLPSPVSYTIKLSSPADVGKLSSIADGVRQRFAFVSEPALANVYSFESRLPLQTLRGELAGSFVYLERDTTFKTQITVNDPGFTQNSRNIDKQWALPKAGFTAAWEKTTGSLSNVVAIIDTGVDETHEDLQNINFVPGYNVLQHVPLDGRLDYDDNGHGTLMAGILGASANNGKGVAGANWVISIMPIKALDADGNGDSSDIAEAVVWAVNHGANLINLSLGGTGFGHDTTLADAIKFAFEKNAVIVAAAGNDSQSNGNNMDTNPVFPVCNDNDTNMVIGVASVDQNDLKTDFSNYGKNCVDVAAPGKRILSTINFDPATKTPAPDSYAYASGTSLAVPYVVAEAALIRAYNPGATNVQIRDQIMATADKIDNINLTQCGGNSCDGLLGTGRINVDKALAQPIGPPPLKDGDVVKDQVTGAVFQISGGQKRRISDFVLKQRFASTQPRAVSPAELQKFPEGPYAIPIENTLVKSPSSGTIYIVSQGLKLPLTIQVFKQRKFSFANVSVVSEEELNSWTTGNFYPPLEGTLLRTAKNKTVFWVVGGILHPVNYRFYVNRGLKAFPVVVVPDADVAGFTKGEAFIN